MYKRHRKLKSIQNIALFSAAYVLSFQIGLPGISAPNLAQSQTAPPNSATPFEKAKRELPEDLYVIYRIVDRLSRANDIDDHPWRVRIVQQYNVNAFASETNVISVYTGLLDNLGGDYHAIACVVAHEMAHHTKRHLAVGPAEEAKLRKRIAQEAQQQVDDEMSSAQADATGATIGGAIARGIGRFFGGWGALGGSVAGSAAASAAQDRMTSAQVRVQEIIKEKNAELTRKLAEESQEREYEADQVGYKYMATGGFEAEGCLRMLSVLNRLPGTQEDSTHPAIPKRIDQMQFLIVETPPEKLERLGELRIKTTRPLTYEPSKDGLSLRINSIHGGGAGSDFDREFGQ